MRGPVRAPTRAVKLTAAWAAASMSALALTAPPASSSDGAAARASTKPNVLVIMTDDQRASRDTYKMLPALMRKVRDRGIWFRNAVATHPLCCPSRVSIFTGQYAHNHKTTHNSGVGWNAIEQKRTIQYTLGQAGYRTAIVGKFVNFWREDPPYFDRWAIMRRPGYHGATFNVQGRLVRVREYSTTYIGDKTVSYLERFERRDDVPWLMYVEPWAPHKPSIPEEKYASADVPRFRTNPATEEKNRADKPTYVRRREASKKKTLKIRANMLRTLLSVNDMVRKIMRALRSLEERNTIVLFLSDNGYQWYEHKLGSKRYPYEHSVRVPMFLRWRGKLPAGEVRRNIVGNIDVAPTIYDLTGIEPSYTVDGRSMLHSKREHILVEYWHERHDGSPPTYKALWHPSWTYVEYEGVGSKDRREYYGPQDPWQLHNVFGNAKTGDEPDAERLSRTLQDDALCAGNSCP